MTEERWVDEDDLGEVPEHDVRLSSRKIWRKGEKLGAGLVGVFHRHKSAAGAAWVRRPAPLTTTTTQRQLLSAGSLRAAAEREWTVRKIFQTDHADALRSVVQTIDVAGDLVAYAGLDKVLHFLRRDEAALKRYTPSATLFLEGLGVSTVRFLHPSRMICSFHQKSFVGLLDLPSQRLVHLHKLTRYSGSVAGVALHPQRQVSLVHTDREACLVDGRTELVASKSIYARQVRAAAFVNDSVYVAAFGDARLRLFDIRKSLSAEMESLAGDFATVAGDNDRFACGGRGGLVKLYGVRKGPELMKTFTQLTTDIGEVALSSDYLIFSTPWKRNGVRIADTRSLRVMPAWPNVKTNLGTVKSVCLTPQRELLVGNSLGHVNFYEIKD